MKTIFGVDYIDQTVGETDGIEFVRRAYDDGRVTILVYDDVQILTRLNLKPEGVEVVTPVVGSEEGLVRVLHTRG